MRHIVAEEGLEDAFEIDSAGTGSWHIGDAPDPRSRDAAAARGIFIGGHARQVTSTDLEHFDYILAADQFNLRDLQAIAPTDEAEEKIYLLREFDPMSTPDDLDVPDPYYGGADGFNEVIDLVEAACRGLLDHVLANAR